MRKFVGIVRVSGIALLLGACSAEPIVASFNAGLARGFVINATERSPAVAASIGGLQADLVCLQEVWFNEDIDAVLAAARNRFPYSHRLDTTTLPGGGGGGSPPCTTNDLQPLVDCVTSSGCLPTNPNTEPVDSNCVLANCSTPLNALPSACQTCLFAQVANPLPQIQATCTGAGGGGLYAFGGSNGVILLSRTELTNQSSQVFESTTNRRVVLTASTELPGVGMVNIGCTHLTAILSSVPYTGTVYASWEAEQAAQITQLTQFVESRAPGQPTILIGDMNTGPAIGTRIVGEVPDNYAAFTAAGYADPYITFGGATPECTFCADNTINDSSTSNVIIDHIFSKGVRSVAASRILDRPTNITVNGQTQSSNLSDHYGIAVQFTKQ